MPIGDIPFFLFAGKPYFSPRNFALLDFNNTMLHIYDPMSTAVIICRQRALTSIPETIIQYLDALTAQLTGRLIADSAAAGVNCSVRFEPHNKDSGTTFPRAVDNAPLRLL